MRSHNSGQASFGIFPAGLAAKVWETIGEIRAESARTNTLTLKDSCRKETTLGMGCPSLPRRFLGYAYVEVIRHLAIRVVNLKDIELKNWRTQRLRLTFRQAMNSDESAGSSQARRDRIAPALRSHGLSPTGS